MFSFELKLNEQLVLVLRQTKLVLVKPLLISFLGIYLPWSLLFKYELFPQYRVVLLAWTGLITIYFLYKYILWLINVYLITNFRLVNVTYHSLIKKRVAETPLDQISNISFKSEGVLATMFNYGDVEVKINVVQEPLILKNTPRPHKIKDLLWEMRHKGSA